MNNNNHHQSMNSNSPGKDLELLSEVLDTKFKGPWGIRFGLDGIIGLIPVAGDIFTGFLSSYIVLRCALKNYPKSVIIKMVLNIFIETLIGMVPFFGDLFDFYWKSNTRNINLAKKYEANKNRTRIKSNIEVGFFALFILMLLAGVIAAPILLVIFIFDALF